MKGRQPFVIHCHDQLTFAADSSSCMHGGPTKSLLENRKLVSYSCINRGWPTCSRNTLFFFFFPSFPPSSRPTDHPSSYHCLVASCISSKHLIIHRIHHRTFHFDIEFDCVSTQLFWGTGIRYRRKLRGLIGRIEHWAAQSITDNLLPSKNERKKFSHFVHPVDQIFPHGI